MTDYQTLKAARDALQRAWMEQAPSGEVEACLEHYSNCSGATDVFRDLPDWMRQAWIEELKEELLPEDYKSSAPEAD